MQILLARWGGACRVCRRAAPPARLSSLRRALHVRARGFRGTLSVRDMLARLHDTESYNDAHLPQDICDACLDTTLRMFCFYHQCRDTEKQLAREFTLLCKRVSSLHAHVMGKNKQTTYYNSQDAAIIYLNDKKIEFMDYTDSNLNNKLVKVYKHLNPTLQTQNIISKEKSYLNAKNPIKTIKEKRRRINHFENDLTETTYHCSYCLESFVQKSDLTDHLKKHHNIYDVAECSDCGRKFKTIQLLKQHAATHNLSSKCSICKTDFDAAIALEDHINKNHREYKFKCTDCKELFKRERDVRIHQWNTHKIGYEYYCKICGKKFKNYYGVKTHEDQHLGYDCDKCGQKFNTKLKLKSHMVSCYHIQNKDELYSDVEKYTCNYCSKDFYRKSTLRQHILNIHMFPKSIKCLNCDKRVSTKTQLEAHMLVHTRERREQCSVCGKHFVTKYALTYHTRLHTGERPYPCDQCEEKFLSASRRMAHIKRKHVGRTEQCNVCSKRFFSGYALKRHMQRHLDPNSTLFESNTTNTY